MSSRVSARLTAVLINLFPFLEPFIPPFLSLYLSRQLRSWKEIGLISDYSKRVRRVGRLHYEVSVDVELTQMQLNRVLREASGRRVGWR